MNSVSVSALLSLLLVLAVPQMRGAEAAPSPAAPSAPAAAVTNAPAAKTHRLEETELRELLTAALNQKNTDPTAQWELRLTRPWTPLTVPEGPLTLDIVEPAFHRMATFSILRFELRAGNTLLGSWQMPVQAKLWRDVLVADANLNRGQILSEASLTHERRDVLSLREPLTELPANASRYELAEGLTAGAPLLNRVLRLKPVVFRGQTADAIVSDGALLVTLKVEVLEEGVPGQLVRVRNLLSRRELRGKVQDEKTIRVIL